MRAIAPVLILTAGLAAVGSGCARRNEARRTVVAPALAAEAIVEEDAKVAASASAAHGTRRLVNLDAPVYVDGAPVAVLRYGDLPEIARETLEGGTPSFRVADYLAAIGVPLASVRSVHFHGNNDRVASIEGKELAREPRRFTFTFSSQTTGTPVQRWDTEGLANEFVVHEIRKVSVFVKKAPVAIHPRLRCHLATNGSCTDAVPYADTELAKGTRVVLDGRIVGVVKRRQLGDGLVLGESAGDDTRYSVARLAKSFGVPESRIASVELVSGDEVIARADAAQWARVGPTLAFTLARHQHGKARVHVPAELQAAPEEGSSAKDEDALVSAVHIHRTPSALAPRPLARISPETDLAVRLASNEDAR